MEYIMLYVHDKSSNIIFTRLTTKQQTGYFSDGKKSSMVLLLIFIFNLRRDKCNVRHYATPHHHSIILYSTLVSGVHYIFIRKLIIIIMNNLSYSV